MRKKHRCPKGRHKSHMSKMGRDGAILHQVCGHCGETLPLGRAAKADPVELRAAQLIIGKGPNIGMFDEGLMTRGERNAAQRCATDRHGTPLHLVWRGMPVSGEAGWLAYEIVTHDAQRAEEYRARHGLAATDPLDPAEVERDIPSVPAPTAAPWEHATADQILDDVSTISAPEVSEPLMGLIRSDGYTMDLVMTEGYKFPGEAVGAGASDLESDPGGDAIADAIVGDAAEWDARDDANPDDIDSAIVTALSDGDA